MKMNPWLRIAVGVAVGVIVYKKVDLGGEGDEADNRRGIAAILIGVGAFLAAPTVFEGTPIGGGDIKGLLPESVAADDEEDCGCDG